MERHFYFWMLVITFIGYSCGLRCYSNVKRGLTDIIIVDGCAVCSLVINECDSTHRCETSYKEPGLWYKYEALFYRCLSDLCNYVVPLPTPKTK